MEHRIISQPHPSPPPSRWHERRRRTHDAAPVEMAASGTHDRALIDVALAIEVVEHIDGHETLFREISRVLRPGGIFLFSTPNILSLKSRVMFLFTGYAYSFPSLDPVEQHISPFTLDRYLWRIRQAGLEFDRVAADKYQNTSRWLLFLAPFIWLRNYRASRNSASVRLQNATKLLLGRTLLVVSRKPPAH
ncbi:MAG TPA: methyltransferase domain-containing protein [Gammaproteobacteria bacterium]